MKCFAPLQTRLQMSHDVCVWEHTSNKVRRTMINHNAKNNVAVLVIDLAKQSFQLHGVDSNGATVLKKNLVSPL